jgi:molybdopterin converting factor small subunit
MGGLRKTVGGKENYLEYVEAPKILGDVLTLIEKKHQMEIRRDCTLILVNGVEARALADLDTMITDGDEVVFVPMYHGG